MSQPWTKQEVHTDGAPAALAKTSAQAIRVGPLLFVTGQTGRPPDGRGYSSDPAEQARQTLENVQAIVDAGGSSMSRVIKRTTIVRDAATYEKMKAVIESYFPTPVASTTVCGALLNEAALIEMEVVAVADDGGR